MYNKEKFHNTLALSLGSEIVKDKRLDIYVDDSSDDVPKVTVSLLGTSMKIEYDASENYKEIQERINTNEQIKTMGIDKEIINIIKSANAAFNSSIRELMTI